MRWVVVGSGGFIGSALVESLLRDSSNLVYAVSRREPPEGVREGVTPERFVLGRHGFPSPDALIFLSSGIVPSSSSSLSADGLLREVATLAELLDESFALRPTTMVLASSGGALYGHVVTPPIHERSPVKPSSPYGLAKVFLEHSALQRAEVADVHALCLRLTNPYGPGQDSDRGGVGVIDAWARRAVSMRPVQVFGDPSNIFRDFLYITDVVQAFCLAATQRTSGVFNVGGGQSTTLEEVLRLIGAHSGEPIHLERLPARPFDPRSNVLDSERFRELTGWSPQVSLSEGISRTLEHLRSLGQFSPLR